MQFSPLGGLGLVMSRYCFLPKAGKQYKSYQVETRGWLNINIQQPFVFLYLGHWLEQSKFWPMLSKLSELSTFKVHRIFQSCLHSCPNTGRTLMPWMFSYYWVDPKVHLSFFIRCNGKIQTNVLGNAILLFFQDCKLFFTIWYLSRLPPDYHMLCPFPMRALVPRFLLKYRNIPYSQPWIVFPCLSTG